jgi:hypothetical protein
LEPVSKVPKSVPSFSSRLHVEEDWNELVNKIRDLVQKISYQTSEKAKCSSFKKGTSGIEEKAHHDGMWLVTFDTFDHVLQKSRLPRACLPLNP